MKTEHLEYMLLTAELGSISKAARELYMTQPQLSNIIRDMEGALGFSVFVRKQNGVIPTPQGKRFLVYARRILNEAQNIKDLRFQEKDHLRFQVSSVKTSLVMDCFLQLMDRYQESEYRFSYYENGNPRAVEDVYTQSSDLGVVYLQPAQRKAFLSDLTARELTYHTIKVFRPHIILSRDHPLLRTGEPVRREQLYDYGMLRYAKGLLLGTEQMDNLWYDAFLDTSRIKRYIYVYDRATLHNLLVNTNFFTVGTDSGIYQEDIHFMASIPFTDPEPPQNAILEMGYITNNHVDFASNVIANEFVDLLMKAYAK